MSDYKWEEKGDSGTLRVGPMVVTIERVGDKEFTAAFEWDRGWVRTVGAMPSVIEIPPPRLHVQCESMVQARASAEGILYASSSLWADVREELPYSTTCYGKQKITSGSGRGTSTRPCENCGATSGGNHVERGFYRCASCGYPGQ